MVTNLAAPIQRYGDCRLWGAFLTQPFSKAYQWTRVASYPLHPRGSVVYDCALKALRLLTGALALAATALPALAGRILQIMHYHSLSQEARAYPRPIAVREMNLPALTPCRPLAAQIYYKATRVNALSILRHGFDPKKTPLGSKMGDAIYYASANESASANYGKDLLLLSVDVRPGEIAYLNDDSLQQFARATGFDMPDRRSMADFKNLFHKNGYRAILYDLSYFGAGDAWAIFDTSCLTIKSIMHSPIENNALTRTVRTAYSF